MGYDAITVANMTSGRTIRKQISFCGTFLVVQEITKGNCRCFSGLYHLNVPGRGERHLFQTPPPSPPIEKEPTQHKKNMVSPPQPTEK